MIEAAPRSSTIDTDTPMGIEANPPTVEFSAAPSVSEQVGFIVLALLAAIVAAIFTRRP
jgi:hypothetical protein